MLEENYKKIEQEQFSNLERQIDAKGTVAHMNVGQVIATDLRSETSKIVQKYYGPRVYALLTGPHVAVARDKVDPWFVDEYQTKIRGYETPVIPFNFSSENPDEENLTLERIGGRTLRVYMPNSNLYEKAKNAGASIADIRDREAIDFLELMNNKFWIAETLWSQDVSETLSKLGIIEPNTHAAPKPIEVSCINLMEGINDRLIEVRDLYQTNECKIKEIYSKNGVPYVPHEPRIMIRPSWGGGGYEAFWVRNTGKLTDTGEEIYETNINEKNEGMTLSKLSAILQSQNGSIEKYTLTRFLQVIEVPGVNYYNHGEGSGNCYIAPVHGQILKGTQCLGTTSMQEELNPNSQVNFYDGTPITSREKRQENLMRTRQFANYLALQMNQAGALGFGGADIMNTGFFEYALSEATEGTPGHDESVGSLAVAEVNTRPTQRTMHLFIQLSIAKAVNNNPTPITVGEVLSWYEATGVDNHYTSHDKWPLGEHGWKRLKSRPDLLAGINGTRNGVYIIMPSQDGVKHAGLGIMADSEEELKRIENQLNELAS